MTEPPEKDALEKVLRLAETPEDVVFLLRAGSTDDDVDLLERQALRLARRYTFDGDDCFGVSVFAATEETEAWVLALGEIRDNPFWKRGPGRRPL